MDARDLLDLLNEHRAAAGAVVSAGSAGIGWLASWWWNRPRIVAIDRAGGREAFRELPRQQRRRMVRDARREKR